LVYSIMQAAADAAGEAQTIAGIVMGRQGRVILTGAGGDKDAA
jgi:hypothetical protein